MTVVASHLPSWPVRILGAIVAGLLHWAYRVWFRWSKRRRGFDLYPCFDCGRWIWCNVARQNAEPDLQPMCAKCVAADLFELPCKVCGKPVEVSRKYAAHGLFDNGVGCDECSSPSGNQGSER